MENEGERNGITKKPDLVHRAARREYLDLRIKSIQSISEMIENHLASHDTDEAEAYVESISDTNLDLKRIMWSQWQLAGTAKGGLNPYNPEDKRFKTNGGVYMRSKSERDIGNLYEELGIPYAYEYRLRLEVTAFADAKGTRIGSEGRMFKDYYPDFTIFLADRTLMIHEHLGRVDLADYRMKNGEKLLAMAMNGISPDRIVLTFEKDMKDMSGLRQMLIERVMPFV